LIQQRVEVAAPKNISHTAVVHINREAGLREQDLRTRDVASLPQARRLDAPCRHRGECLLRRQRRRCRLSTIRLGHASRRGWERRPGPHGPRVQRQQAVRRRRQRAPQRHRHQRGLQLGLLHLQAAARRADDVRPGDQCQQQWPQQQRSLPHRVRARRAEHHHRAPPLRERHLPRPADVPMGQHGLHHHGFEFLGTSPACRSRRARPGLRPLARPATAGIGAYIRLDFAPGGLPPSTGM
ncbi:hypothetical protein B0H17DRAFT_1257770, partial [Mycena rosella]